MSVMVDPQLFQSLCKYKQLQCGIIEKVASESVEGSNKHYIATIIIHYVMVTPTKTTKVRVVYNASVKTKQMNKSLNE